ncbi:MAG: BON domain-containing protein [Asgard group archaeon]|nr:BON domain-containing protein [Asgard group archaeon]
MTLTEENIKKNVVDQLYWDDRVDASKIDIDVTGKEVTLKGSVPSYNAREAAVLDAWETPGVSAVHNEIEIEYPTTYTVPSDDDIKTKIKNQFDWNPTIDEEKIDIAVENGIVELTGTVDSYWKKIRTKEIASETYGISDIENKLSVVPTDSILDKVIAEDIVEALDRNLLINAEDIDVKVKDGKATLTCSVNNWSQYRAVLNTAERTAGVVDIDDNVIIT